jgi:ribonuclease Z
MRTTLDPRLVDPTAFEPGLVVDVRDERRALLLDLGEIDRLAARTLLRVSHAFVTHTHMDHFAGFDAWLALGLGRMPHLRAWGGPGFVDQVEHKLRAYTWNVVHRYEVPMVIEANALEADGSRTHARFASRQAFAREDLPRTQAATDAPLLDDPLFAVRATIVDHEMPVLAFAIDEKAQVRVAADRIAAAGLATGAWLRTLKEAVLAGVSDDTPLALAWRDAQGEHAETRTVGELRPLVLDTVPGRRIGYVTDLRFTEANIASLERVLADVDLLHVECVFAEADRDQAARKNHLTARQAGEIARRLRARRVVPFHFSPRYRGGDEEVLRAELAQAWGGPPRVP